MITRRTFIQQSLATAGALAIAPSVFASKPQVMTVTGPIAPDQMGFTLPHEHIMSIFGGQPVKVAQYDEEKLFAKVIPYLKMLKVFGVQTICECTGAYFGRRVDLLRRISRETGMQILTNTGYFGAAHDRYVPAHAFEETIDQIAQRWINEWETGIDGTDIRPGFIKIGVDPGMPSDIDKKLILAAGKTHLKTGLDNCLAHKWQHGCGCRTSCDARRNGRPSRSVDLGTRTTRQRPRRLTSACAGRCVDRTGWHQR